MTASSGGFIGRPLERHEDLRLVRGRGKYVDDLVLPRMLHAVILRSPVAHGTIRGIGTAAARRMPGVHAIFTAADLERIPTIPVRLIPIASIVQYEQPVIARKRVNYVGEPIAVVVADSAALAEDALDAIELDIESLAPVTDASAGTRAITYTGRKGDPAARAAYMRRERFRVQRHTAVHMEPRGLLAEWDGARSTLVVTGAAKVPFTTRRILAGNMDLPEDCVEMLEPDIGGGFGVRGEYHPEDFLIPFAARRLGRPVKWIEDRRENLLAANHSREMACELEIACERDGTIVALRGTVWVDIGAYLKGSGVIPPRVSAQAMAGPYRIPNVFVEAHVMLTNKTPVGSYRGPGRFEDDFFRERLFEMAARDLGIDPIEFRRRNLPTASEMPYPLTHVDYPDKGDELDSGDYPEVLDRCLREFDWAGKRALQGRLVDGRYHGIAASAYTEGGGVGPRESARMKVEPDGTIAVYVGASNVGQGLETICLQIASDALDVPPERLHIFRGSTTHVKEGFGSFHSRSVVMAGSAIGVAAAALKARVRAAAAERLGCVANEVTLGAGLVASHRDRSLALHELGELEVEEAFHNQRHTYAVGAVAAHVAVDPRTGQVDLLDYLAVQDIGKVINPLTATGQLVGAVIQGLGGVFLEELRYDGEGQLLTGSLADYLLPTATDFPNVRAIVTGDFPSPINPLGAKGAGEGGTIPVGGVVANAVANALGVELHELPLSPAKLWALLELTNEAPGSRARADR